MTPPGAGLGKAERAAVVLDLGQHGPRDAEALQEPVVPVLAGDVEEHGAAGVRRIGGMHPAAGQPPEEEAVDGAAGELAAPRPGAGTGHVVEQPLDLGGGEIGVDHEPGRGLDVRLEALGHQLAAQRGRAPVLPDDGIVDRPARGPVPDDGGLALVGDADGGDGGGRPARTSRSPRAPPPWCRPRCARGRARPSRLGDRTAAARAAPLATGLPRASNRIALLLVVP
jgi:hypothetical protein